MRALRASRLPARSAGAPARRGWKRRGVMRMRMLMLSGLLAAAAPAAYAEDGYAVVLRAPLTTVWSFPPNIPRPEGGTRVHATITVPPQAPADLGVGLWVSDQHGRWYQRGGPALHAGVNTLELAIDAPLPGQPDGHEAAWNRAEAAKTSQAGLYFWSAAASHVRLEVSRITLGAQAAATTAAPRLQELLLPGLGTDGRLHLRTGERWTLSCAPDPFPGNPYDAEAFAVRLVLTSAQGVETDYDGFYQQPMSARDGGDHELVTPSAAGGFQVRYRPQEPGIYQARLEVRWGGAGPRRIALPAVEVSGDHWDQYVRVDPTDHRFFSVDGAWWFPVGPNLRSVFDRRCQQYLGTTLTPDRGLEAYHAYFERLGAAHATCVEVWLCSWNLALEWRGDWDGYYGAGRYNEANAWKLDQLLDDAYAHGLRVNLVVDNHGQASVATDHEWENHPYNRACGGFLDDASMLFSDPRAAALQERMRRYLVARYADHPGLMSWKLWSEINLTAASEQPRLLEHWHQQALARWHSLDPYHHPCTTHWAGNYRTVDHLLAGLPGLDFICIDAYHNLPGEQQGQELCQLLLGSVGSGERRGDLSRLGKPVYVTEYGGNWNACPPEELQAEHASGAFLALVCGHAGAPMLWWFEWLDQGGRFAPYRAISAFIQGEDLRDLRGASVALTTSRDDGAVEPALWARAWSRPGRLLGYVLDRDWGSRGMESPLHHGVVIGSAQAIAPGAVEVEWWDADRGQARSTQVISHPGGVLLLTAPDFTRHLAFKLSRAHP